MGRAKNNQKEEVAKQAPGGKKAGRPKDLKKITKAAVEAVEAVSCKRPADGPPQNITDKKRRKKTKKEAVPKEEDTVLKKEEDAVLKKKDAVLKKEDVETKQTRAELWVEFCESEEGVEMMRDALELRL